MISFTNPWLVGIGGGVLSGFLVAWISQRFLSKREDKEYIQKINAANRDVIYAVRPGISEGQIPTGEVIVALTNSTSRRYGISASDLYRPREIAEELIKEVMDSSFLSSAKKSEYCAQLAPLYIPASPAHPPMRIDNISEPGQSKAIAEYRDKLISMVSIVTGILAGLMSTFLVTRDVFGKTFPEVPNWLRSGFQLSLGIVAALFALLIATFTFYADSRRDRQRHQKDNVKEDMTKSNASVSGSEPK